MSDEKPTPTTTAPPAPEAAAALTDTSTELDPKPTTTSSSSPEETKVETKAETKTGEPQEKAKTPLPDEPTTPLQELWATAKAHEHDEVWGVTLADPSTHVPSQIVLQKYLNANDGDIVKARDQLTKTLDWRKSMNPRELVKQAFSREKFGGLGYVTVHSADENREIFTWNIYGKVKSIDVTFGDLNEFIKWRVALMELAVQELSLQTATVPITADPDADPYKIFQVHDYNGVSFFRQSSQIKAASKETIHVFATAYPELLKEKFFVNVPTIMGFMYGAMKLFVAARTIKKFHPITYGENLAKENFGGSKVPLGKMLPKAYGGEGDELQTQGTEPKLE
ncbi:CRAL-TRIO domain-containing protein [Xylaria bambusicola]|uniref:CRAL-TRIO domain-containing protein n=1 Tax=Xylaria bambusicola TaxID=326684 RepID=UPI0020072707|nr:CRAL-TRIO domain-containing protein [Xylaria bambusicola]KAI0505649.1 CRAL-TRIO domain-containing protein [Xylaria bambusicola]